VELSLALVVAIGVVALVLLYVGRRRRGRWQGLRRLLPQRAVEAPTGDFVGREHEQREFEALLEGGSGEGTPHVVLVTGAPGLGKTELLRRLVSRCEVRGIPHTPVLRLPDYDSEIALTRAIAERLRGVPEYAFKGFDEEVRRHASPERPGRLDAARAGGVELASAAAEVGVPVVGQAGRLLDSQAFRAAVSYAEYEPTAGDLTARFIANLVAAAQAAPRPTVLFFSQAGSVASAGASNWVVDDLLPRLGKLPILVVISAPELWLRAEHVRWPLQPLAPEEVRKFGSTALGLIDEAALEELVRRAEGIPARLGALRTWYETHESERGTLSPEAVRFALSRSLADMPPSGTPLRRMLLALSACRSFDITLVEAIARDVVGLDGAQLAGVVEELLDPSRRPSFVVDSVDGWSLGRERLALLDQWQRMDDAATRRVHETAARHHFVRLRTLEGEPGSGRDPPDLACMTAHRPLVTRERLLDDAYVATLAEYTYHLLALAPDSFIDPFVNVVGHAVCLDAPDVGRRLLDLDGAVPLTSRHRAYVAKLRVAVEAYDRRRWTQASRALADVVSMGCASRVPTARMLFAQGYALWSSGYNESAVDIYGRSWDLLADGVRDRHELELRTLVLPWWLRTSQLLDRSVDVATPMAQLRGEAEALGDAMLLAEVHRAEGVLIADVDPDAAETHYRCALKLMTQELRQDAAADTRLALAILYLGRRDLDRCREELDAADRLAQAFQNRQQQRDIRLQRLTVALQTQENPDTHRDAVLELAPGDAGVLNQVAQQYQAARHYEEAVDLYRRAAEAAPEEAVFPRNQANALLAASSAEEHATEVEALYRKSVELAPADASYRIELAQHLASVGRQEAAAALAGEAAQVATDRIASAPAALVPMLLEQLRSATALCGTGDRVAHLARATALRGDDLGLWREYAALLDEARSAQTGLAGMREVTTRLLAAQEKVLELMPHDDPARVGQLLSLTRLQLDGDALDQARQWLDEAASLAPDDAQVAVLRGRLDTLGSERLDGSGGGLPAAVYIRIAPDLVRWAQPGTPIGDALYSHFLNGVLRPAVSARWGVLLPAVRVAVDGMLQGAVRVELQGEARAPLVLQEALLAAGDEAQLREVAGSACSATVPWTGQPVCWVDEKEQPLLAEAGIAHWDPRGLMCCALAVAVDGCIHTLGQLRLSSPGGVPPEPALTQYRTASVVRELLARRRPVHDAARLRTAVAAQPGASAADVAAGLLTDDWPPEVDPSLDEIALSLTSAASSAPDQVTVRCLPEDLDRLDSAALSALRSIVLWIAGELGLPGPTVTVVPSRLLSAGKFELWAGSSLLASRGWDDSLLAEWRARPELGDPHVVATLGGHPPTLLAGTAAVQLLTRPEALLDALGDVAVQPLLNDEPGTADEAWWRQVVGALVRQRVPLPAAADLVTRARPLVGEPAQAAALRLADDLHAFEVTLLLTPGLLTTRKKLGADAAAGYALKAERLFDEFGVDVPVVLGVKEDASLPEDGWALQVNRVRRCFGRLPAKGLRAVPVADPNAQSAPDDIWLHPATGEPHRWAAGSEEGYEQSGVLVAHAIVSVRLALAEFADLSWLRRHLRRVAESDPVACDTMLGIGEQPLLELMTGLLRVGLSTRKPWVLSHLLETYAELTGPDGTAPEAADVIHEVSRRLRQSPSGEVRVTTVP
jgi:tetratricopeptide (TPR) repeat protein